MEKLNSRSGAQVLTAGTRGCGKSVFGLIILMDLLQENQVVIYSTRSRRFLIIPEEPKVCHLESLSVCFHKLGYNLQRGIYDLITNILVDLDLYHILDLGEDSKSTIPRSNVGRILIIFSPDMVIVSEGYILLQLF